MPTPAYLPITVQWNEDYSAEYALTDAATGDALDLSGCTVTMELRSAAGVTGAALASATISSSSLAEGVWGETISQATLEALAGDREVVRLAYDVLIVDPDGLKRIWRRGPFIIEPGVTQ